MINKIVIKTMKLNRKEGITWERKESKWIILCTTRF